MRAGWCFKSLSLSLSLFFFFFFERISIFMSPSLSLICYRMAFKIKYRNLSTYKKCCIRRSRIQGILIFPLLTETENVVIVKQNERESQPDSKIKVIAISITITAIIMMMASVDNDHCDGHMSIVLVMEGVRILTMIMMMVGVVWLMLGN